MKKYILLLSCAYAFWGCDQVQHIFSSGTEEGGKGATLARVHDKYLYESDVNEILPARISQEDSANIVGRYINSWINRELILSEAEKNLVMDEAEMERRMQDYKFQLLMYAYERKYVDEHLDTTVTDTEIQAYYDENEKEFLLKSNIVRGLFLKFPKEAPKLDKVQKWMRSSKEEDKEELRSLSYSYADFAHLNDEVWLDLDELLFGTPFMKSTSDKIQALKRNNFWSAEDGSYQYYFLIEEYKIIDQVSPLQFVQEQVREIIINRRKLQLASELEKKLYDQATINKDYEVYR
ncbi:peptidyl-prolyl cis-trans isomerase [Limibacter armeniacum]|uniref:peptidyl-prolyl cis-trans isomerase n=1 Tax=Limibacter armeniacum TaxID=466084 RepID=UPI002FE5E2B5